MDGSPVGLQRALALGPEGVIQQMIEAGLRDRDNEDRPTGERMRAHSLVQAASGPAASPGRPAQTAPLKRLVCDCADVEPGLEINRFLLASHGPLILEGARIVAHATSSPSVVFHVGEGDQAGQAALAGYDGAAVVAGPFRPDLKGYEDAPTMVITGETLLNVARILRVGPQKFRRNGTAASAGTKLFQVCGPVGVPGIFELPLGFTLRHLIDEVCGGIAEGEQLQAVEVGGARGTFYTEDELDLPLEFDSVRRMGGIIGSGAVAVLGRGDCVIDQLRRTLSVCCHDLCGACALGREGSYQLREIVNDMTRGRSRPGDLELLREIAVAMRLGCACASGRTFPNLVLSGLQKFEGEYEAHMKRRRCKALVCTKYVTFHILPELCDGCGACAEECPEDAIAGGRSKIHVIDQETCGQCGNCHQVCLGLRKAVVKAGAVKPRTPKRPIPVGSWEG